MSTPAPRPGLVMALVLSAQTEWVHRRVESVRILDNETSRRQVSVDFTLPRRVSVPETNRSVAISRRVLPAIPLTILRKGGVLRNFDLRDETGMALPLFSRVGNERIAAEALVESARGAMLTVPGNRRRRLPPAIERDVELIAGDQPAASQALRRIRKPSPDEDLIDLRAAIGGHPSFAHLAELLTRYFILLTPAAFLDLQPGQRRILKFSYEEPLESDASGLFGRLARSMPGSPRVFKFQIPAAAHAASFHFEIAPPQELDILELGAQKLSRLPTKPKLVPMLSPQRAHAYLRASQPADRQGRLPAPAQTPSLVAWIGLDRAGFMHAALATVLLAFGMLVWGRLRLHSVLADTHVEAMVTALLLIPSLLGFYLLRPDEHRLVRAMLFGTRIAVLLGALSAVVAAVSLAVGYSIGALSAIWDGAIVVSALALVGVLGGNWPLWPRGQQ